MDSTQECSGQRFKSHHHACHHQWASFCFTEMCWRASIQVIYSIPYLVAQHFCSSILHDQKRRFDKCFQSVLPFPFIIWDSFHPWRRKWPLVQNSESKCQCWPLDIQYAVCTALFPFVPSYHLTEDLWDIIFGRLLKQLFRLRQGVVGASGPEGEFFGASAVCNCFCLCKLSWQHPSWC